MDEVLMAHELAWTPERVKRFWNEISASPLAGIGFAAVAGSQLLELVAPYIPAGGRALDFGAGAGQFTRKLLDAGYDVGVFEPADGGLAAEIRDNPRVTMLAAEDLESSAGSFDLLFCLETIEHVLPEEWPAFTQHLLSLLRPGGRLVVSTPNNEELSLAWVYCVNCDHRFHPWQHVRSFTASSLAQALDGLGFRRIAVGAADFSANAAIYSEVLALRRQIGDIIRLMRATDRAGDAAAAFTAAAERVWQVYRQELLADLRSVVRPVLNELNDTLRLHGDLRSEKPGAGTRELLPLTQIMSNHLNELIRQLNLYTAEQPFPMQTVASFAQALNPLLADLLKRSVEAELGHAGRRGVREEAAEMLAAQVRDIERLKERIDAVCNALILRIEGAQFALPDYAPAAAGSHTGADEPPVGKLSELDDAALLEVIGRGYQQLLRRRGRLEWGTPERMQGVLDFHYGAGQTLVYVGEKPG